MKKRVLFTYATYGTGHRSAARNIMNYFISKSDEFEVLELDISDHRNFLGKTVEKSFEASFKHTNSFGFGFLYKLFNNRLLLMPETKIVKMIYSYNKIRKIVTEFNPDITISTHFFPSIIISDFNKEKVINSKIITVLTDYKEHTCWLKNIDNEDALIVGNEYIKNSIIEKNEKYKDKIHAYGIPIAYEFKSKLRSEKDTYNKYKLNKSKKTILFFAGGGYGSSLSLTYLKRIVNKKIDANIVYVCGRNEKLKKDSEYYVRHKHIKNVKVLGYTNDVINLLNISTIVITKPGGLTLTECLEMKKPVLLIQGNNANEKYNTKFVCKKGFGFKALTIFGFTKILKKCIEEDNYLDDILDNLAKYKENNSSEKIYKLTTELLKQ